MRPGELRCRGQHATTSVKSSWRTRRLVMVFAMVVTLTAHTRRLLVEAECSNGFEGVESDGVCCFVACGTCGGEGCSDRDGTRGEEDCCVDTIQASGQYCAINTPIAPCIIAPTPSPVSTSAPTTPAPPTLPPTPLRPPTQQPQVHSPPTQRPSTPHPTPVLHPTPPGVFTSTSTSTSSPAGAPMTQGPTTPPPNVRTPSVTQAPHPAMTFGPHGSDLSESPTLFPSPTQQVTQAPSTQAPSTQAPSTQTPSTQNPSTQTPSTQTPSTQAPSTQAPSAVILVPTNFPTAGAPPGTSTCSNGMIGVGDGEVCCVVNCGQCGGSGCSNIPGTNGGSDCCENDIIDAGLVCYVDVNVAPCIMQETPSPTPADPTLLPTINPTLLTLEPSRPPDGDGEAGAAETPSPSVVPPTPQPTALGTVGEDRSSETPRPTPAVSTISPDVSREATDPPLSEAEPASECSNGMLGYEQGVACCPIECGQCGGAGCESIPGTGGRSDCCSDIIIASGVECDEDAGIEAPCVMGTVEEVTALSTGAATSLRVLRGRVAFLSIGWSFAAAFVATALGAAAR